ncbi:MAG: hypothetical protein LBV67_00825 [Streptococcaceae bacterium]|jgi:hypothetical protein|nr:hypothetical protein [Streptococcaceae bacterium]
MPNNKDGKQFAVHDKTDLLGAMNEFSNKTRNKLGRTCVVITYRYLGMKWFRVAMMIVDSNRSDFYL